jgi:hypothetical protein
MTLSEYIDAATTAADSHAGYAVVHQAWQALIAKELTADDYERVYIAWESKWFPTHGGTCADYVRGGPRPGGRWTGD